MATLKKEPKPKFFGPDIFGWGGGLPREGPVVPQSTGPSPEQKVYVYVPFSLPIDLQNSSAHTKGLGGWLP